MIRRKQAISLIVGGAVATGVVFVGIGLAKPSSGLNLTNVPTPNTKSDGFAPPSKLSPELKQIAVAQGATKLENPSALTSYYGYDNDSVNSAGEPVMVPTATNPTEAHKTGPDNPLIGEERPALVRSYESLLAAVRTDEATSRE